MQKRLNDYALSLLRFYAGGDAVVSWYNAMHDSQSHLYRIGNTPDGSPLLWVMAIAGALIVLDVLMNDWTPSQIRIGRRSYPIRWHRAFVHRHLLFVLLAFCYAAQPYVAERGGYGVSLLVFFYWNAFQNIALAFFDAKQRSRSAGWQRAYS